MPAFCDNFNPFIKGEFLTILLPAYNEEATLGELIDNIREYCPGCKILVVDNNSTDKTGRIATSKGATTLNELRQGKGHAVRTGIRFVETPYTIMMDADNTYPAFFIRPLLSYLIQGFDVAIGAREQKDSNSMSQANRIGNRVLTLEARILYSHKVHDLCSGMWGFRTDVLKKFDLTSTGFTLEADFLVNACKSDCSIISMPITYRARANGSQSSLHLKDGLKIGWFLLRRKL